MSSLWKRASPREVKVLRIIAGAVLNTNDAHPGRYVVDAKFARGVAKRAVGTLSAQWSGVLAVGISRSSVAVPSELTRAGLLGTHIRKSRRRKADLFAPSAGSLAPIKLAEKEIARRIKPARLSGETARADALVEALKVLGHFRKEAECHG